MQRIRSARFVALVETIYFTKKKQPKNKKKQPTRFKYTTRASCKQ